jgi:hypothetical protein
MEHAGTALCVIKDSILIIIREINALRELKNIMEDQLPVYLHAMQTLSNSVNRLHVIYNNGIPIQHTLKFALLNNLNLKLRDFEKLLKKLNAIKITIGCFAKLSIIICNPPSKIINNITHMFEEINIIIIEIIKLENTILGSAIRIEHPMLQLAWLLVGENQLNDSFIDSNILIQSLLSLLKKEVPDMNEIQEQYYIKLITSFVHHIDNIGGTHMDSKISILELNQIKSSEDNCNSVQKLIENQYKNIISHNNEIKDHSNVFLKNPLNTLMKLHSMNVKLNKHNDNDETKSTVPPNFFSNNLYIQNVKIYNDQQDETKSDSESDSDNHVINTKNQIRYLEMISEEDTSLYLPPINKIEYDNMSNNSVKSSKSSNSSNSRKSVNRLNNMNKQIKSPILEAISGDLKDKLPVLVCESKFNKKKNPDIKKYDFIKNNPYTIKKYDKC